MGVRKSIVIGCGVALLVCVVATAVAIAKTFSRPIPSPFVKGADLAAVKAVAEDEAEPALADSPGQPSRYEPSRYVKTDAPAETKSASQLDAEDRYYDRMAGRANGDPKGTLAAPQTGRPGSGIPLPVGGINVVAAERGAVAQEPVDTTQAEPTESNAGQQQVVPYADGIYGYGYGGFPALPVVANGATTQNPNTPRANQPGIPPGFQSNPYPAPTTQTPTPPPTVPYQTAPVPQPIPYQTQPPPAAQRGF